MNEFIQKRHSITKFTAVFLALQMCFFAIPAAPAYAVESLDPAETTIGETSVDDVTLADSTDTPSGSLDTGGALGETETSTTTTSTTEAQADASDTVEADHHFELVNTSRVDSNGYVTKTYLTDVGHAIYFQDGGHEGETVEQAFQRAHDKFDTEVIFFKFFSMPSGWAVSEAEPNGKLFMKPVFGFRVIRMRLIIKKKQVADTDTNTVTETETGTGTGTEEYSLDTPSGAAYYVSFIDNNRPDEPEVFIVLNDVAEFLSFQGTEADGSKRFSDYIGDSSNGYYADTTVMTNGDVSIYTYDMVNGDQTDGLFDDNGGLLSWTETAYRYLTGPDGESYQLSFLKDLNGISGSISSNGGSGPLINTYEDPTGDSHLSGNVGNDYVSVTWSLTGEIVINIYNLLTSASIDLLFDPSGNLVAWTKYSYHYLTGPEGESYQLSVIEDSVTGTSVHFSLDDGSGPLTYSYEYNGDRIFYDFLYATDTIYYVTVTLFANDYIGINIYDLYTGDSIDMLFDANGNPISWTEYFDRYLTGPDGEYYNVSVTESSENGTSAYFSSNDFYGDLVFDYEDEEKGEKSFIGSDINGTNIILTMWSDDSIDLSMDNIDGSWKEIYFDPDGVGYAYDPDRGGYYNSDTGTAVNPEFDENDPSFYIAFNDGITTTDTNTGQAVQAHEHSLDGFDPRDVAEILDAADGSTTKFKQYRNKLKNDKEKKEQELSRNQEERQHIEDEIADKTEKIRQKRESQKNGTTAGTRAWNTFERQINILEDEIAELQIELTAVNTTIAFIEGEIVDLNKVIEVADYIFGHRAWELLRW